MPPDQPSPLPTPERIELAAAALRKGAGVPLAAQVIGISPTTWLCWLKRGEEGEGLAYRRFWQAVSAAEAECALEALQVIHEAAEDGDWQAAAWLLERRFGYTTPIHPRHEQEHAFKRRWMERLGDAGWGISSD